jgi:predicted GNAT superfamily acetyltransferase
MIAVGVARPRAHGQANERYSALMIYKALQCYEYQSCEHSQWPKSEAFRMYEAAIAYFARVAIDIGLREAYERAPWTLDE